MGTLLLAGKDEEFQVWWEWPDNDPDRFPSKVYLCWMKESRLDGGRVPQAKILIGQLPSPKDIELCNYLNQRNLIYENTNDYKEFFRTEAQIATFALRKIAQTSLPMSEMIPLADRAMKEIVRLTEHFNEHGDVKDFDVVDEYYDD